MILVNGGPDIPWELFREQEEGRLIFFCGAGISRRAGLPDFTELTTRVCTKLGADHLIPDKDEGLDGIFERLETEEQFDRKEVRERVVQELTAEPDADLSTHRAILDLATDIGGKIRLVTTNFENLFDRSSRDTYITHIAPALPVPKPNKWNSVVYLHGRIHDEDPERESLILSSSDFGSAYLVDRWASRFVTELFQHFTVIFVGYGVNDPVMRYLVDALAAERRAGRVVPQAYMMVEEKEQPPNAVIPVRYNPNNNYEALHSSLKKWAGLWREGVGSRKSIVREIARHDPQGLSPEEVSQVCWAVADEDGVGAKALSALESKAHIGWIKVFADRQDKDGDIHLGNELNKIRTSDVNRNELSKPGHAFVGWFLEHLGSPELVSWVTEWRGQICERFLNSIEFKLRGAHNLPSVFEKFWRIILQINRQPREEKVFFDSVVKRVATEREWNPTIRGEVLQALSPELKLRSAVLPISDSATISETRLSKLGSFYCDVRAPSYYTKKLVNSLTSRTDWTNIADDICLDLTMLLRSAMDLQNSAELANHNEDKSRFRCSAIKNGLNFPNSVDWTYLILILKECVDVLISNHKKLRILAQVFLDQPYPIFRRLALYAAAKGDGLTPAELLEQFHRGASDWVWSPFVKPELLEVLAKVWRGSSSDERKQLSELIRRGPPKALHQSGISTADWERARDRDVWERLTRLRDDVELDEDSESTLEKLDNRYPKWGGPVNGNDVDVEKVQIQWGGSETDITIEKIIEIEMGDRLHLLTEESPYKEGRLITWRQASRHEPSIAIDTLIFAREENNEDPDLWESTLTSLPFTEKSLLESAIFLNLLVTLPDELFSKCVSWITELVEIIAPWAAEQGATDWWILWDRGLELAPATPTIESEELLTLASFHPVGQLTSALCLWVRSKDLGHNEGLPLKAASRFKKLFSLRETKKQAVIVKSSANLRFLHDIDTEWVEQYLLPCLDWHDEDQSFGGWCGFLSNPRLNPSLWVKLKKSFLSAFDCYERFDSFSQENLCELLFGICIDGDGLPKGKARNCLRKIDREGRTTIAQRIMWRMESASESGKAEILWKENVGLWLEQEWPRQRRYRWEYTTGYLATAAIYSGTAFPEAIQTILPILGPMKEVLDVPMELIENGHVKTYPTQCMELLDCLFQENTTNHWNEEDLQKVMQQITETDSSLSQDSRFKKLRQLVDRHGG